MPRPRLLTPLVARLLLLALVVGAVGIGAGAVGRPEVSGLLRTAGILVAATALVALWARRGHDRLERLPAVSAVIMAVATALAAVAIIWLLNNGPDRPIGLIGVTAAVGIVTASAAASAGTTILIRAHVEAMPAHVWSGIGGAGLAIPFIVAGAAPEAVMAGAVGLAIADRAYFRNQAHELAVREARLRGEPVPTHAPRWTPPERRRALLLGLGAVLVVALAWAVGIGVGELLGSAAVGQAFAVVALAVIPLALQAALLMRCAPAFRPWAIAGSGMLALAALTALVVPLEAVSFAAIALQSAAVALLAGALARLGRGAGREGAAQIAVLAATLWWLTIVPTGGLLLAVVAIVTTAVAFRRKAASAPRPSLPPQAAPAAG